MLNKVCAWRHDMPPPHSSPCGRRSASRCRADRWTCRWQRSSSFPRSVRSHPDRCICLCVNAAVSKPAWWPWPFDLESGVRVTWATSVLILVFLGLSVLDLGPMYATDRRQTDRRQTDKSQTKSLLNASAVTVRGHNNAYHIVMYHVNLWYVMIR